MICHRFAFAALLATLASTLHAQDVPPSPPATPPVDSPPTRSPASPAAAASGLDFSGVLFANFQYRGDEGPAKATNKFDIERAYLTFRAPVGERASVRITADVFQQPNTGSDSFYRGWVVRMKYAYLQYNSAKSANWNWLVRGGLVQTVVIDHVEMFWPRWLSVTPVERAGFFSSADAGLGAQMTLPRKLGEAYVTVANGPGYTSREVDRFKDYSGRISFTPFGSQEGVLKTFTLTGWTYRGAIASAFVAGGPGQIGPVGESLRRNRLGIFVGLRSPSVTLGSDYAVRTDGSESGDNSALLPRSVSDSTGRLISGFTVLRPFQFVSAQSAVPLAVAARWDHFKPNRQTAPYSSTVIVGVIWEFNKRASIALDYQEQTPHGVPAVAPSKTYFAHLVASF